MSIPPTPEQLNALQKLFDTGVNRANTMLNYLSELTIDSQMSPVELLSPKQLKVKLFAKVGVARVGAMELFYNGEFEGWAGLIFSAATSRTLVNAIADQQRRQLDRHGVVAKTLTEVGNIFFNGLMGSISQVTNQGITYMAPSYREGTIDRLLATCASTSTATAIFGQVQFHIDPLPAPGKISVIFIISPLEKFLESAKGSN